MFFKTYTFVIIFSLLLKTLAQKISCPAPLCDNCGVNWYSCGLDDDSWYGITKIPTNIKGAQSICQSFNSELISIESENTDICAYYSLILNGNVNQ